MRIILCDNCGARVMGAIAKIDRSALDFCSRSCAEEKVRGVPSSGGGGCMHEDNMDGTAHDTPVSFRHLVCRACGFDRMEPADDEKACEHDWINVTLHGANVGQRAELCMYCGTGRVIVDVAAALEETTA